MIQDVQLSQYDIATLINNLAEDDGYDLDYKLHLVTDTNKDHIKNIILSNSKNPRFDREFFLLYYNLGKKGAHWACLVVDYENRQAYFYCSYGIFIDNQFKFGDNKTYHNNLVKSVLRRLYKLGFTIHYNNSQLQHFNSNVCGRYIALFIYFNMIDDFNPDDFNTLIINNKKRVDPDDYVLSITQGKF